MLQHSGLRWYETISRDTLQYGKLQLWISLTVMCRSCDHVTTILQVLRSIGFRASPVEGVPHDRTIRTIPNVRGRVTQGTLRSYMLHDSIANAFDSVQPLLLGLYLI